MKKKINKDYTNHWLYPYIGSYAMNFFGMSFGRLYQMCDLVASHRSSGIDVYAFVPTPIGDDKFVLTAYFSKNYTDDNFFDLNEIGTTYPYKLKSLRRYGTIYRDELGYIKFKPRKQWIIK